MSAALDALAGAAVELDGLRGQAAASKAKASSLSEEVLRQKHQIGELNGKLEEMESLRGENTALQKQLRNLESDVKILKGNLVKAERDVAAAAKAQAAVKVIEAQLKGLGI